MIAIINIGSPDGNQDLLGLRKYEVRINDRLVTTFAHKQSDGLGRCLLEASKAVERDKWESLAKSMENMK